jgi:hypothetical protein
MDRRRVRRHMTAMTTTIFDQNATTATELSC